MENESSNEECGICLQKLLYPVKLPCNHTFCFLCIKGIRRNSAVKTCAMCRTPFNLDQIEENLEIEKKFLDQKIICWFYEGKSSGMWAYDNNSNEELERAYNENKDHTIISIAGFAYCIDFKKLIQYPVAHPERIRKIKRTEQLNLDESELKIKGIAGLKLSEKEAEKTATTSSSCSKSSYSNNNNSNQCDDDVSSSSTSDVENLSKVLSESLQLSQQD